MIFVGEVLDGEMSLTLAKAFSVNPVQESSRYIRQQRTVDDYQQHTLEGQIYANPDNLIGSPERNPREDYVFDFTNKRMILVKMDFPEAFERLYLEILSNAGDNADASLRMGVSPGGIDITMDESTIRIRNGGEPIPLLPTKSSTVESQNYVPESVFGTLLTSSNYDTKVVRTGAGKNGYGATLCNLFSKMACFSVGDKKNGQEWRGVWQNNMREKSVAINPGHVWNGSQWALKGQPYTGPSYVEVTYVLDFARFGYEKYPPEALAMFARFGLEFSLTCKVPISINGVQFNMQSIKSFASLFWSPEQLSKAIVHHEFSDPRMYSLDKKQREQYIANPPSVECIPIVEIICVDTPDSGICLGYVNGMITQEGGVHVNEAYNAIGGNLLEHFNKPTAKKGQKKEEITAKLDLKDLKQHMSMIITCRLFDTGYRTQTKTYLTKPKPVIKIGEDTLKPLGSWNIFDRLSASMDAKLFKSIKKSEKGGKGKRVHVEKGVEANEAGGPKASQCILYIVEGQSAASYPKKRISMSPGNKDFSGYYPIKGKFPNIMKMNPMQVANNKEIKDIKALLKLREGVTYEDPADLATLRYGLVVITTDMDSDGSHIRMLLISFFRKYIGLIKAGKVCYLATFAVRLFRGTSDDAECVGRFTTVSEYEAWAKENPNSKLNVRYYKGLGTSTDSDIKDDMTTASLVVCLYDEGAKDSIDMAFGKDSADDRKRWIATWRDQLRIDDVIFVGAKDLVKYRNITDIINKDLIDYTIDALYRAVPCELDLLKRSQRQALYYILHEWNYGNSKKGPMKVEQIGNAASNFTKYHHGSISLSETIIRMCQFFVGSNNMPCFARKGQLGTRDEGGKDASHPRYVETRPESWVSKAFNKEMVELVPRRVVEAHEAEPFFIPCDIPIGIINGFNGMATGHSTYSPPHSVLAVIEALYTLCSGKKPKPLQPYFHGFKGEMAVIDKSKHPDFFAHDDGKDEDLPLHAEGEEEEEEPKPEKRGKRTLVTRGVFKILKEYPDKSADVFVSELPIERWNSDYHKWLDGLEAEGKIKGFRDNCTDENDVSTISYVIYGFSDERGINHKTLKLQTSFGLNNITLINVQGRPHVYDTIDEVLLVYYKNMIEMYSRLREKQIEEAKKKQLDTHWMIRLITAIVNDQIIIMKKKQSEVYDQMTTHGIPHEYFKAGKLTHLNEDGIKELELQFAKCQQEIDAIAALTPEHMWATRLAELGKFFRKEGKML
jgi:DNA topoisomerase-2